MSNERQIRHCYVYTGKAVHDSPSEDIFATLEEAVTSITAGPTDADEVVITFADTPEAVTNPPTRKPKYQYFYDTHLIGVEGDGTDIDPWPTAPVALDAIVELQRDGKISPKSGQSISIKRREIFTATSIERKNVAVKPLPSTPSWRWRLSLCCP